MCKDLSLMFILYHLSKMLITGKMQRDRRKMREKRRSTGVVYLGAESRDSGESSCDEEDGDSGATLRNTKQNESLENGRARGQSHSHSGISI